MSKTSSDVSDIEIYRTTPKDFDKLTDISSVCFPNQLRWRAPKSFCREWWNILINSDFCEVWTCASEGKVAAYCAIVFDRMKFEHAWQNFRPGFGARLYIFASRPNIVITKLIKQVKKAFGKKLETSNNIHAEQHDKMEMLLSQKVSWLGPAAVSPDMQCKGIATRVCKYCADRAAELGYKEMWGYLLKNNIKSKGLVKKLGFEIVDEVDHLLFIKMTLVSDKAQSS